MKDTFVRDDATAVEAVPMTFMHTGGGVGTISSRCQGMVWTDETQMAPRWCDNCGSGADDDQAPKRSCRQDTHTHTLRQLQLHCSKVSTRLELTEQ